jgi:hypothetical protein
MSQSTKIYFISTRGFAMRSGTTPHSYQTETDPAESR